MKNPGSSRKPIIKASEIGQYIYCRRAWWLRRVKGIVPDARAEKAFRAGDQAHEQHNQLVASSFYLQRLALIFCLLGLVILFLGLLFSFK